MTKKIEEAEIVTTIAEYSATEKGLALLRDKLKDAKYDVTTTAGMDLACKDRRECVTLRTSLEAKRKEIKAPALARCQQIDSEAKRIEAEIVALEGPINEQIKAEENRKAEIKRQKEEAEALRVTTIKERIAVITGLHLKLVNVPNSLSMREIIQTVREQVTATEAEFQEWQPMAQMAIDETLRQMEIIVADKEAAEIEEIRKANEYQRQQFELKVQGMIQEIRGWAYSCFGHDSAQLAEDHAKYAAVRFTAEECGCHLLAVENEAVCALIDIEAMIDAAKKREESERQMMEEQKRMAREKEEWQTKQDIAAAAINAENALVSSIEHSATRFEGDSVAYIQKAITSFETGAKDWDGDQRPRVIAALAAARKQMSDRLATAIDRALVAAEQKAAQDAIAAERAALDAQRREAEAAQMAKDAESLEAERIERERLAAEAQAKIDEQRRIDEERRLELEKKQQAEFVEKMKVPFNALRKIKEICENKELTALAARNQINAVADIALEGKE